MTRWAVLVLAACVVVAGCDDSPTAPTTQPLVFTALLFPANEVPPVANAESAGRGAVQVQFDVTRDAAGAITAATASFYYQLHGYPGDTLIQGAHIHSGPAGVNAPIVVDTGASAINIIPLSRGVIEVKAGPIAVTPAIANAIVANPAAFYFNVHSPLNPGGFSRGQLTRIQ
jgi:hypothetical protein